MNGQELDTAAQHDAKSIVLLLNNDMSVVCFTVGHADCDAQLMRGAKSFTIVLHRPAEWAGRLPR